MDKQNTQLRHINGLKGLACLMVMFGHFIGLYKYAESFPTSSRFLQIFDTFLDSKLNFIIDESFWVILFFFVSGYLVSISKIPDIKNFFFKSFSRFLRLGLPILTACAIIFIIQKTIGFHNSETVSIFESSFIQKPYSDNFSFWQVIKSPIDVLFLKKTAFCSPYWVLREMFITSVTIYFFSFLKHKINNTLFVALWGTALFASMIVSYVIFAGLLGMTLNFVQYDKDKHFIENKLFLFFTLSFCLSLFFISRSCIASIFFGALVLITPKINFFNVIFSYKLAQFINTISFGIYSFHWPVFCSFGMLALIKTYESIGLFASFVLSSLVATIVTIVISILYYFFIEKRIYKALKVFDALWKKKTIK